MTTDGPSVDDIWSYAARLVAMVPYPGWLSSRAAQVIEDMLQARAAEDPATSESRALRDEPEPPSPAGDVSADRRLALAEAAAKGRDRARRKGYDTSHGEAILVLEGAGWSPANTHSVALGLDAINENGVLRHLLLRANWLILDPKSERMEQHWLDERVRWVTDAAEWLSTDSAVPGEPLPMRDTPLNRLVFPDRVKPADNPSPEKDPS